MTVICKFSKYLIICPIPNKESKTIAKSLLNECILTFGPVKRIRSDLGTEYINRIMSDLTALLDIHHDRSTAYHHETMGTVERSHRTLNEYLRNYLEEDKNWPTLVKYFEYAYNTTPNTSIDMYTPFEIVFGRSSNKLAGVANDAECCDVNEYIKNVRINLDIAFKKAEEFLKCKKEKTKLYYDKSTKPLEVKAGDKILLVNEIRSKLDPLYKDEYIVKEIRGKNVVIRNPTSGKELLVHKNRIRKY